MTEDLEQRIRRAIAMLIATLLKEAERAAIESIQSAFAAVWLETCGALVVPPEVPPAAERLRRSASASSSPRAQPRKATMTDRTALRARIVGCVEIVHSQAAHMGNSVVPLAVLKNEIGFFEGLHTRLAPIVLFAERARGITWDGDTQEMTSNDDETAR